MPSRLMAVPERSALAIAAVLGPLTFAMLEAAESVLRADRSFAEPMSDYAVGPYGFVQTVAFVVLALGSAAVCAGLRSPRQRPPNWQIARVLIGVWSLGVSLAAVFRVDVNGSGSAAGQVHGAASGLSFLAILAAMFVFTNAARQAAGWRSFSRLSFGLAGTAIVAFVVAAATQPSTLSESPSVSSSARSSCGSRRLVLGCTFSAGNRTSTGRVAHRTPKRNEPEPRSLTCSTPALRGRVSTVWAPGRAKLGAPFWPRPATTSKAASDCGFGSNSADRPQGWASGTRLAFRVLQVRGNPTVDARGTRRAGLDAASPSSCTNRSGDARLSVKLTVRACQDRGGP